MGNGITGAMFINAQEGTVFDWLYKVGLDLIKRVLRCGNMFLSRNSWRARNLCTRFLLSRNRSRIYF